ncbi:hypothetical protein PFBG_04123 [Plasmodium falciparum 7G8]|uniref:Erythrocyte membrane protein 1 n=1 Tax=Plasmodium falciparum (isolate 7G8) TaxID=57266 RepID=W7F4M1_PLAF8|nr:hypothetical protein PFBG_04123 [Plasmodium falciparum 7G8]
MAPVQGGTQDDAKHVLDKIGQQVHDLVKNAALDRSESALQGILSKATYSRNPSGKETPSDPCDLNHEYHTNVTVGYDKENPCKNRSDVRFSYTEGAECNKNKISGSNDKEGACAPYRRLHLCDQHLENINDYKNINNHTLLTDVCLAAKFEAESLKTYRAQYQEKYGDVGSTICTVLARSFADIGDIVRGRDLYRGNNKEKEKLENNLKTIFKKIYDKLLEDNKTNGKNVALQARYQDDADNNYFQLREDWWALNRKEVWKAITCGAAGGKYFRNTCVVGNETESNCRCKTNDVPTYFDYVPQYLRWFEEWAEDFCRKKKKYVDMVKTNCGGKDGKERYCDRDGFDCEKTIRAIFKYARGENCHNCIVWCGFYENWIENQKKEFLKQKKKYETEIPVNGRKRRSSPSTEDYEGYEKQFYEEFKRDYGTVDKFLEILSKEEVCTKITEDDEKINFKTADNSLDKNINNKGTFYHSKYCEICPECGVKRKSDGQFVNRTNKDEECKEKEEEYNIPPGVNETKINVLYSGKGRGDITEKLKEFCEKPHKEDGEKNEQWECYYKDSNDNKCRMKKAGANDKNHAKIMSFNDFFNFWVGHVLTDAQGWRTQLTKCLSEDKLKKCEKGCKSNCECFKKWIEKKEQEWIKVKQQFNDQPDFGVWKHYLVLKTILEEYYFENIQKAYGDLKSIQEMKKMIEENQNNPNRSKGDVDALDVLFDHELEEAEDCLDIHEDDDDADECVEESEKIPNNPCSGTRHRGMVKNVAADMYRAARQQLAIRAGGRKTLRADASKGTYKKKSKPSDLKENICNINTTHSNDSRNGNNGEPCHGKDKPGVRFEIGTPWKGGTDVKTSYKEVFLPPRREHMCTSNLEKLDVSWVTKDGKASHSLLGDVLLAAKMDADEIITRYKSQNNIEDVTDPKDNETVCRALRYSFADLGDIIRGRDLWDDNNDAKSLQTNLKAIFKKIKEKHPGIEGNNKYVKDNENKQLRSDWWTANRRQVWRAMKCALKGEKINCGATPHDDYIPQRLRWMTEWAEWYCKMQSQEYETLQKQCGKCTGTNKHNCTRDNDDCSTCKNACDKYKEEINKWKKQWEKISGKYLILYLEAQRNSPGTVIGDPNDQQVVDFLTPIHKASIAARNRVKRAADSPTEITALTPITPYFTAAGYIHQELPHMECQVQNQFCKKKNGVTQPTGEDNTDPLYTFKQPPPEYKDACGCEGRNKPVSEEKDACEIVEGILAGKKGNQQVGECNPKDQVQPYPGWDCKKNIDNSHSGACMPPRRQKLCLYYIAHESQTKNINKEEDLRDAFIRTAAAETFISWQYYKIKNGADAKQLDNGTIPEEFLRSMYFTYGDYRDLCLDTDISKKEKDVGTAKTKIDTIFRKPKEISPSGEKTTPKDWWQTYGKDIWKGMICALTHGVTNTEEKTKIRTTYSYENLNQTKEGITPLENFAEKPQFLRWMIEWGEEFCRERKKLEDKVNTECNGTNATNPCNNGTPCKNACDEYKNYVETKQKEFRGQTDKFVKDANGENSDAEYKDYKLKEGSSPIQGNDYLINNCDNKKCSCMEKGMLGDFATDKPFGKYAYDKVKKCNCYQGKPSRSPPPSPPVQPQPEAPQEPGPPEKKDDVNVCKTVEEALKGKLDDACNQKYAKNNSRLGWRCVAPSGPTSGDQKATPPSNSGATTAPAPTLPSPVGDSSPSPADSANSVSSAVCIPPRRRRLYVKKIHDWAETVGDKGESKSLETSDQKTPVSGGNTDALRDAFIQSAAIETFFLWHRYKQLNGKDKTSQGGLPVESQLQQPRSGSDDSDPQTQLKRGKIPPDFLRLMFYTLGDYRDLCVGKTPDGIDTVSASDSGDNKSSKNPMQEISDKIKTILNPDNNKPSVPPNSDKDLGKLRAQWWDTNAQHIWHGMIYALTYKEDTSSGDKPTQDPTVRTKLWDDNTKKPKPKTDGTNGKDYTYGGVRLEDENSGTQALSPGTSGEKTTLDSFIKRPPYFRYLEEWGQNFCKERKKRLEKIEEECMDGSDKKCSGYGEDCKNNLPENPSTFKDLEYPTCAKYCRFYRKWIGRKKDEYDKQEKAYGEQQKKGAQGNSGIYDEKFVKKLDSDYKNIKSFLQKLVSCSKNDSGKDNEKIFEDTEQTFKDAENCKPCSEFKINCKKAKCSGANGNNCNGGKISPNDIKDDNYPNGNIEMLVSDDSANGFKDGLQQACGGAGIFKGIRKDEWTCEKLMKNTLYKLEHCLNDG